MASVKEEKAKHITPDEYGLVTPPGFTRLVHSYGRC